MISHQSVVDRLRGVFPGNPEDPSGAGVALVARYEESGLGLPAGPTHIFLPDCHLLSHQDAEVYKKNHFVLDEDLRNLLEVLSGLKAERGDDLTVWHLGDLFDIWRARGGQGAKAEVDEIMFDHAEIVEMLRFSPPAGVKAEIIAGNHDYSLHTLEEWRASRFRILRHAADEGGGDVLLLHGDSFDWLERTVPEGLKAFAVRLATGVEAGGHELEQEDANAVAAVNRGLPVGDRPIGAGKAIIGRKYVSVGSEFTSSINVVRGDGGNPDAPNKKFFAKAKSLADELSADGFDIRAVVIGHTHFARIVKGAREGGVPFVLMDCGAWFGKARLTAGGPWVWGAQIGVLAGNDLRIYQLGWRLAED